MEQKMTTIQFIWNGGAVHSDAMMQLRTSQRSISNNKNFMSKSYVRLCIYILLIVLFIDRVKEKKKISF